MNLYPLVNQPKCIVDIVSSRVLTKYMLKLYGYTSALNMAGSQLVNNHIISIGGSLNKIKYVHHLFHFTLNK